MQTKEIQGRLWSRNPAHWVKYIEPTYIPMYREILNQLMLHEEHALLDAGCGAGLFLSMAAPTGALLHGVDAAQGMLALARNRVPGAFLTVEDLEALPYIDGTFDVVTGLNSFQYAGSFKGALAEARRVVKRHGKIVIGIWSMEETCDARAVINQVEKLLPIHPATATLSDLDEDGSLEDLCKRIGLRIIRTDAIFCPWAFNSDAELLAGFLSTAPCVNAVQQIGEDAVSKTILEAAQHFNLADDVYYLRNFFRLLITEKI